jgi:membrane protein
MSLKNYCKNSDKRRFICHCFYILKALIKDFQQGELSLRAMGLVFTTFLSLVPLLAFSFSILKAFGVHNQMEPLLLQLLEPLGVQGVEITQRIVEFVGNIKVGALGTFGFLMLIYTIVSLTRKIEDAFNFTWRVETNRNFMQRFSHYISVIVVAPILMFSALGISASFMSSAFVQEMIATSSLGVLVATLTKLMPIFLIISAFSFSYWFIPNTKVKARSAIIGGVIAGSLWQFAGWAFASYIALSTQQTAIYSVFAGLFFFFLWMYVGWMILLIGSSIACYVQRPEYARYRYDPLTLAGKDQERLAVAIMRTIARQHYAQKPPYSLDGLRREIKIPIPVLNQCLELLMFHQLLTQDHTEPPHYLPLKPLSEVCIQAVIDAVRAGNGAQIKAAKKMLDGIELPTSNRQQTFRELNADA